MKNKRKIHKYKFTFREYHEDNSESYCNTLKFVEKFHFIENVMNYYKFSSLIYFKRKK